jgi:L-aspartate semialdehyde sulfurtransferase ferredoxin
MTEFDRLYVSIPAEQVPQPLLYDIVKQFDVVPNVRRANVEDDHGWIILELRGDPAARLAAIAYLRDLGCIVDDMTGDIVAG